MFTHLNHDNYISIGSYMIISLSRNKFACVAKGKHKIMIHNCAIKLNFIIDVTDFLAVCNHHNRKYCHGIILMDINFCARLALKISFRPAPNPTLQLEIKRVQTSRFLLSINYNKFYKLVSKICVDLFVVTYNWKS